MERRHIHRPRIEEYQIWQDWDEWFMEMDHVELLVAKECLDGRVERHVERHPDSAAVGRDRYGSPDTIKTIAHLEAASAAPRREHRHFMSMPHELGSQMRNVLEHTTGMRRVIRRNKSDLHRREPNRFPATSTWVRAIARPTCLPGLIGVDVIV
jgi:hypothetical protein